MLILLLFVLYTSKAIYEETESSRELKVITKTYLGCKEFSNNRKIYKYLFVVLSAVELLLVPNLLALPILFFFLLLMIFAILYTTIYRNRETTVQSKKDSDFKKLSNFDKEKNNFVIWAVQNERLFAITMEL